MQSTLVLVHPALHVGDLVFEGRVLALCRLKRGLNGIKFLGDVQAGLSLCRKLRSQIPVLRMQLVERSVLVPRLLRAIVQLASSTSQLVFDPLQVAFESISLELQGELSCRVAFAQLLPLLLERLECALDIGEVSFALFEKRLGSSQLGESVLKCRFLRIKDTLVSAYSCVMLFIRHIQVGIGAFAGGSLRIEGFDKLLYMLRELFLLLPMDLYFSNAGFVLFRRLLQLFA